VPDAIVEQAQAWLADLIVMGTRGRRGLQYALDRERAGGRAAQGAGAATADSQRGLMRWK
jgi:nucleotide-binding universal stress UspA family protein